MLCEGREAARFPAAALSTEKHAVSNDKATEYASCVGGAAGYDTMANI
jgi:hypothetical protein